MSRVSRILSKIGLPAEGTQVTTEENAIVLEVVSKSHRSELLGSSVEEQIQVSNWLSFSAHGIVPERLEKVNNLLVTKSYLVGNALTVADVAVFVAISDASASLSALPNVSRWFSHIKRIVSDATAEDAPRSSTAIPSTFFVVGSSSSSSAVAAAPEAAAKAVEPAAKTDAKADAKPAKEGKKEKAAAAPKEEAAPVAAAGSDLDPSKLDIRVGLVVKCWNHPESEKLLCEEIDIGEGTTRTIASGLRAFYSAEEVQGRKVVVLANLKERPMAGFKSQGMVLCAVTGEHSNVKLLSPPEGAQVGERITFPGFSGEPALATHVAKKKIFEGLAPGLRTDEQGTAMWNQSPFTLASGVVTGPLTNAIVS